MSRIAVACIVASLLAAPLLAAPLQKEQVPADVKWVLHVDMEGFMASKTGTVVLEEAKKQGLNQLLAFLKVSFSFDLTKDLKNITIYGFEYGDNVGVVLLKAKFDREKILNILKANETYKEINSGQFIVHNWVDPKNEEEKFGCFVSDDLAVIAPSMDAMKKALDVLDKKADNLTKPSAVVAPPNSKGAFLTAAMTELPAVGKGKPEAAMFNKLSAGSMELGESGDKLFLHVTLAAKTAQAADDLRKMAEGFLAFFDLAQSGADDKDTQSPVPPELAAVLKDVKVMTQDKSVKLDVDTPVEKVSALLKLVAAQKSAKTTTQPGVRSELKTK